MLFLGSSNLVSILVPDHTVRYFTLFLYTTSQSMKAKANVFVLWDRAQFDRRHTRSNSTLFLYTTFQRIKAKANVSDMQDCHLLESTFNRLTYVNVLQDMFQFRIRTLHEARIHMRILTPGGYFG